MKRWTALSVIALSIIYLTSTATAELVRPLSCSPDEKKILFGLGCKNDRGYIYNLEDKCWTEIEAVVGCLAESWENNDRLGVKVVDRDTGRQYPAVVDLKKGTMAPLGEFTSSVGLPVYSNSRAIFSRNGNIISRRRNRAEDIVKGIQVSSHYTPVSPDGRYIASTIQGMLKVWNFRGRLKFAGPNSGGIPFWSSDGRRLAVNSGNIKIYDLSGKKVEYGPKDIANIGPFYSNPQWLPDSSGLIFISWMVEGEDIFSELIEINCRGKLIRRFPREIAFGTDLLLLSEDRVILGGVNEAGIYRLDEGGLLLMEKLSPDFINETISSPPTPDSSAETDQEVVTTGVPYVNQLYGTPFWCQGYNMCGATSCVMAIGYYGVLPYWPTAGKKFDGSQNDLGVVNSWGNYIPGLFKYEDKVFDRVTEDKTKYNIFPARGIHGEVRLDDNGANWYEMEGMLNEMGMDAKLHIVPKDETIPFEDYCKYIDKSKICLINCKLPGGGHVICGIGYNKNGSVIVNDPYGKKPHDGASKSQYPNSNGEGVAYDYEDSTENGNAHLGGTTCALSVGKGRSEAQDRFLVIDDSTLGTTQCGFEKDVSSAWKDSDLYGYASTGADHPYGNGLYYLNSVINKKDAGWARWWFDLRKRGRHTFYVYIPSMPSRKTEKATYSLLRSGREIASWTVDQNEPSNEWVKLGSKWLRRGSYAIELTNVSGGDDEIVVFDAIMVEGKGIDPR